MSEYIVKEFETITDVCLNATGTISNWDKILEANGFTDWTPVLTAGQILIIPDDVEIQTNVLEIMKKYPACNNPGVDNLSVQIDDIVGNLLPATVTFEDDIEEDFEDSVIFVFNG